MTIAESLFGEFISGWQMEPGERMAFIGLLSSLRPKLAIEIGTSLGGSLSVIAKFASEVYSVDIDPGVAETLRGSFPNVHFLTGDSGKVFPELLRRLADDGRTPDFVLIDAKHTEPGVRRDIAPLLEVRPRDRMYVLVHDSFNPGCRRGITSVPWGDSPYFRSLELDFVPGTIYDGRRDSLHPDRTDADVKGRMWNGLALALFLPDQRISGEKGMVMMRQQMAFDICFPASAHRKKVLERIRDAVKQHPMGRYAVAFKRFFWKGSLIRT